MKNTKSRVGVKLQMLKEQFLKTNRLERNQTNIEQKEQQDTVAIINVTKVHKPVMFENELNKDIKQRHKEEGWEDVFR